MSQYATARDASGAVEKIGSRAFQRRHSRVKLLPIDPFVGYFFFPKRHNIMAATLIQKITLEDVNT